MQCQGSVNNIFGGTDLLKFHKYLAMRNPIVSTDISGVNDVSDVIRVEQRQFAFTEEIEKALLYDDYENIIKCKNDAMENSLPNRINELEQLIKSYLKI